MAHLKLATLNIRGFGDETKRKKLFDYLNSASCDIWLLQETLVGKQTTIDKISNEWAGSSYWAPAVGKRGGVVLLVS